MFVMFQILIPGQRKTWLSAIRQHLVCIHWLTIVYWVQYVDVGQLVQLDNLLLFSYSNINWIYPASSLLLKFKQRSQLCNTYKTISLYWWPLKAVATQEFSIT